MAKTITIKYNNQVYVLEFTRKSVVIMERNGFKVGEMNDKPLESISELFKGSFIAHHENIEEELIQNMFGEIPDKDNFITKLVEMYAETINTLYSDNPEGNAVWEVNW